MTPNNFSTMLHKKTNIITRVLIYAILEWVLIFLLLLNSLFSYFILKFALYFGLKPPCFLCSRIDHYLDSENQTKSKLSCYSEIFCEEHVSEISKIGYCSNHRKFVEDQDLCDFCLDYVQKDDVTKKCSCCDGVIKFNSISKNSAMDFVVNDREFQGGNDQFDESDHKLVVDDDKFDDSKFGYQILSDHDHDDHDELKSEELILKAEKEPLLQSDDDGKNGKDMEVNDHDHHDDDEQQKSEEFLQSKNMEFFTSQSLTVDMLPQHIEFYIDHDDHRLIPVELIDENQIKVVKKEEKKGNSEISREIELVFDGYELILPTKDLPSIQEEQEIENLQNQKIDEKTNNSEKSEFVLQKDEIFRDTQIQNIQISQDMEYLEGLEKMENSINLEEEKEINSTSSVSKEDNASHLENKENETENTQISQVLENFESSENIEKNFEGENSIEISQNCDNNEEKKEKDIESSLILEEEKEINSTSSESKENNSSDLENEENETEEKDDQNTTNQQLIEEIEDLRNVEIENEIEGNQNRTEKPLLEELEGEISSNLRNFEIENESETHQNLNSDENSLPFKEESCIVSENVVSEVSTSVSHDIEVSERGLNSNTVMSQTELEEDRVPDTPTSSESLNHLHKKFSILGRRESVTEESLDGISVISEQENGETIEKLKLDLLSERKALRALYKELEEERNASMIAANQTMAMITRLQEEKATMQMEALQYQRMMEEQSEYDQEALQMMNELVVKREKEKKELEREVEVLRKKVVDFEEKEKLRVLCRRRSRNSSGSCSYGEESDGMSVDLNHEIKDHEINGGLSPNTQETREENGYQDTPTEAVLCLQDSLSGFEEERQSILEQLKVLEGKLFTLAEEEEGHFENMMPFEQFCEENGKDFDNGDTNSNGYIHSNGKHQERRINDSMPKQLLPLFDATESLDSPNGDLNENENAFQITKFELEKKRFAIEEEVDHVYERLQAFEADREFLKHCIGSLKKGDKGLDLLQEILQHLRDLKSVEVQALKNNDQCTSV